MHPCKELMMIQESSKGGTESGNGADNEGDNWAAHCRLDRSAAGEWVGGLPRFGSAHFQLVCMPN